MKLLVTGSDGYIGHVMVPFLRKHGHEVVGLDAGWYRGCDFGSPPAPGPTLWKDVRDVTVDELRGFDAVLHLAALSNDPLGDLAPEATYAINHAASVQLARLAKQAGVKRFIFSSSCSNYGATGGDALLDETAAFHPVTPYARSKVQVEQEVAQLADGTFSPVFMRSATAYGASPRLRGDLLVNSLVATAYLSGEIVMRSDGTPWRPLVHIEDISRAFLAAVEAPREVVHNEAFNVGQTSENFRVRDVAAFVAEVVAGAKLAFAPGACADTRNYRVRFDKIAQRLPNFVPRWTLRRGVEQLFEAYRINGLTHTDFNGARFQRLRTVCDHQAAGRLDAELRWEKPVMKPERRIDALPRPSSAFPVFFPKLRNATVS